jgi:hypothetical protein
MAEAVTAVMTVDGFEKWGEVTVRPRTVADSMLNIPGRTDRLLSGNPNPGRYAMNAATAVAIAQFAIVEPTDLVERIMASNDPRDVNFFYAFAEEYNELNQDFLKAAKEKKSGKTTGKDAASSSDTTETSSPPTEDG